MTRRWSYFTNHYRVLNELARQPNRTVRQIASSVDLTERATGQIIRDLYDAGDIRKGRSGRTNSYEVVIPAYQMPPGDRTPLKLLTTNDEIMPFNLRVAVGAMKE